MLILSIVSSIASIVSLFFALSDYFKQWKSYALNVFFLFLGSTFGLLIAMSDGAMKQFTTYQLMVLIVVTLFILLLSVFIHKYMSNAEFVPIVGLFALLAMAYVVPKLIVTIGDSQAFIKTTDYLVLSEYYSNKGQYMKSAEFLSKYIDIEQNLPKSLEDSLIKKVDYLKLKEIQSIK